MNIPNGGRVKLNSAGGAVVVSLLVIVAAVTVAVSSLLATEICDAFSACAVRNMPLTSAATDITSSSVKPILFLSMAVHLPLLLPKTFRVQSVIK
jgi:hypothetical protein